MCASSFEASAPFTRASHAEYGHFDASLALKQINGLTLHICWMDHVDTMCMDFFKKILGSGASICRQSGFVETGWWVVGHPTNSLRTPHWKWYVQMQQQCSIERLQLSLPHCYPCRCVGDGPEDSEYEGLENEFDV